MKRRFCLPCDAVTNANPCRACGADTDPWPCDGSETDREYQRRSERRADARPTSRNTQDAGDDRVCVTCKQPIPLDETAHYGEVQTCRSTLFSPAEYETVGPFCEACWSDGGRERGDDDGVEYGHPRDRMEGRE